MHRDFGGRGIGKLLLGHLIDVARESGFHVMMARIESSGDASLALHASCGFELSASNARWAGSSSAGSTSSACNA